MTHKSTWKKFESASAARFGARRNVLSGSAGRDDRDPSDSTHERLHIEAKYRAKHAVFRIWDQAKDAARNGKIPIVCLKEKNRPGFLVCVHIDHLAAVAVELAVRPEPGREPPPAQMDVEPFRSPSEAPLIGTTRLTLGQDVRDTMLDTAPTNA
jgi:hypothetical protein